MEASSRAEWPRKQRDIHNHHINSTVWDRFEFRDGDIVICTYAKSGTTWMQQIVGQLIFAGANDVNVGALSPWLDYRLLPTEILDGLASQTHRRFVKSHLPADALVISPKAKYLYIGRDGRDTAWSLHNHYANFSEDRRLAINEAPGLVGPPLPPCTVDVLQFYRTWFAENGKPYWPFFENIRSWWRLRDLPNVMLINFSELKADLPGMIRKIAGFLDIDIDEGAFPRMVEHCSFEYMRDHGELVLARGGASFRGGGKTFMHKGVNGRWRDALTAHEVAAYEEKAVAELGAECAAWLAGGELGVRAK
jgi:aryl sulfotransferase